jgi:hypothetical protein
LQSLMSSSTNPVHQLRGLQQGKVHNARLKAHTQFVQQALGAAGQSVNSLRPAVTRFQECLPVSGVFLGITGARRRLAFTHFGALLSMVYQAARLPALCHAFVLALWFHNIADFCTSPARLLGLPCRGGGAQAACLGVAHWLPALPAPSLANGSPTWDYAGSLGCSCYGCCACHGRWAKVHVVAFFCGR